MSAVISAFERPLGRLLWLGLMACIALVLTPVGESSDLRAMWLAGQYLDTGTVYPAPSGNFTMTPPPEWIADNEGARLFPFLYPPLWAGLAAMLADVAGFETVSAVARILNAALLAGTAGLAWSLTGRTLGFPVFTGLAMILLTQTFVGALALMENQPQIAVSFLVLLALERARAGQPGLAGTALALAAALKVYPVLFAVFWIATRNGRALGAFAAAGLALAGVSIALTGWPLHAEFLAQLSKISGTALLTPVSYALTPALAQVFAPAAFVYQEAAHGGGWLVMDLPWEIELKARVLLLTSVACLALVMARSGREIRDAALWPLALVIVSLLGPLAWAYHYIPAVACAPVLLHRFGPRAGGLVLLAALAPACPPVTALFLDAGLVRAPAQIWGTLGMIVLAAGFAIAARRTASLPQPA